MQYKKYELVDTPIVMFYSKHDAENRSLSDIEEGRKEHEEKKKGIKEDRVQ